jgi:hypothetical protein
VREPGGLHELGQSGCGDPVLAEFSRAAAVTIRSRVFAASILDFLIVSHLLNGAGAGKLPMALDI